ncbi:hypothetical protein O181_062331 [Austropuccinia psidii MF-1]|uniref:Uncharacterized protein n=1 Tax=Austropuccinia psidii MF-1 TaxID=1389203 RepID=A0A9Q3EHT8_9BASI|nr:hypothetical protein [Austropuccinia psidii MF-1]
MRQKEAKGGNSLAPKSRWVSNHNWTHLSQFWPPIPWTQIWPRNPLDNNLAINPIGPIFGHGPRWTIFPAMASGNQQRAPNHFSKHSPQLKGNSSIPPCIPYSRLQEWTKFHLSKSWSQNPIPLLKEDSVTHQSGNTWQQSEDHSRIPITWPCRSWVGNFIQDNFKGILRGYTVLQSVVKASSISITLGQLNWSIQASIKQPVCPWPNWANSNTQFIFKMAVTAEPSIGQALLKEVPKLKEWLHFSGEGEYEHMEFIRGIEMIREDFELPERFVTARFNTLFTISAHRWYIKLRQVHGHQSCTWWKTQIIKKWANDAWRLKVETAFESSKFNAEKKNLYHGFVTKRID